MKNNKKFIEEQQITVLKKYFEIDEDKKIIKVKIHYDKASDMLDLSIGDKNHRMINNDILTKLTEITDKIPKEYKADISFIINDYEDYPPQDLINRLKDLFQMNNFQIIRDKKKNSIISSFLIIIGAILLFLLGIGKNYNWFGTGLKKDIIEEIIDITSWVFIWQAVTVAFLSPSEHVTISAKLISKINSISFEDEKENFLLTAENESISEKIKSDSTIEKIKNISLLVTSTLIFTIGIYSFFIYINKISINESFNNTFIIIISVISIILLILSGLFGIFLYKGNDKYTRYTRIMAIILSTISSILLILSILFKNYDELFLSSLILLNSILFTISTFLFENKKSL